MRLFFDPNNDRAIVIVFCLTARLSFLASNYRLFTEKLQNCFDLHPRETKMSFKQQSNLGGAVLLGVKTVTAKFIKVAQSIQR